jgi:hypothetical protein
MRNPLHGIKSKAYRIQSNLIHNRNPRLLALLGQRLHGIRDIRSRNDVLLGADRTLDDGRMVDIRNQRDDKVNLVELGIEGGFVVDVESDGLGVLEVSGELLCVLEGSAG